MTSSDHAELIGEMLLLEKMAMVDRLKLAKKRRAQQLKAYAAYEKQLSKEGGKKLSKFLGKAQSSGAPAPTKQKASRRSIRFDSSILLLDAASRNDKEEVYHLLSSGVSPNSCNEDGLTALHQCCIDNLEDIVRILLQFGANVNARDTELWTPLHAAATCGHLSLCRLLCDKGSELLAVNIDGNMPYDLCEDGKTLDYIESQMANAGVTQEMIDEIRLKTEYAMLEDLKRIHAAGGSLEFTGSKGETPLHVAASNGYMHVTEFLLQKKVPVDCKDDDMWQPIHCAACWSQLGVVEILLQKGANPEALTRAGESALDLCEDIEVRTTILRMMKDVAQQHLMPRKLSRFGYDSSRRRSSTSRRGSNVTAHGIRRSSIHDKASLAHREAAEEAQRLQEAMAAGSNVDDDDDDDGITLPACTLPPSSVALSGDDSKNDNTTPRTQSETSPDIHGALRSPLLSSSSPSNQNSSSPLATPNIIITTPTDKEFETSETLSTTNARSQSNGAVAHPEINANDPPTNALLSQTEVLPNDVTIGGINNSTSKTSAKEDVEKYRHSAVSKIGGDDGSIPSKPFDSSPAVISTTDVQQDRTSTELKDLRAVRTSSNPDDPLITPSSYNGNAGNLSGNTARRDNIDHSSADQSLRSKILSSSVKKKYSNVNEVVRGEEKERPGCCSLM